MKESTQKSGGFNCVSWKRMMVGILCIGTIDSCHHTPYHRCHVTIMYIISPMNYVTIRLHMLKYFKNFAIWQLRHATVAWYHSFVINLIRHVIIFHVIILSCALFVMSPFCHLSYFRPLNSNPPNIALIGLIASLSSKWYRYKTLHSFSDFQLSFNLFCFFQARISVCYLCLHFSL